MAYTITSMMELMGETPLYKLSKVVPENAADIYVKLETTNIGNRAILNMIEVAEEAGYLNPFDTIVEASIGTRGISVALFGAAKGFKVLLVIPQGASPTLLSLLKTYGAKVVETPRAEGITGAINKARELSQRPDHHYLNQFENKANIAVHEEITGPEIIGAMDGKGPDAFITSVGTGATATGIGRALRKESPNVELYTIDPHIHREFELPLFENALFNGIVHVGEKEANEMTLRLAREEGLVVGHYTSLSIVGAIEIAKRLGRNKTVVTMTTDGIERYFI